LLATTCATILRRSRTDDKTDWTALTARAGHVVHDLVGWRMWDPDTIARYEALGVANGTGWLLAWRAVGDVHPARGIRQGMRAAGQRRCASGLLWRGCQTPGRTSAFPPENTNPSQRQQPQDQGRSRDRPEPDRRYRRDFTSGLGTG